MTLPQEPFQTRSPEPRGRAVAGAGTVASWTRHSQHQLTVRIKPLSGRGRRFQILDFPACGAAVTSPMSPAAKRVSAGHTVALSCFEEMCVRAVWVTRSQVHGQ